MMHVYKTILLGVLPVVIVLGIGISTDYANRPGDSGSVATNLSCVDRDLEFLTDTMGTDSGPKSLLLFYHPHCPCTKATIRNLELNSVRFERTANIVAFGFCPANESDSWISSPLTDKLRQLGARVIVDRGAEYCSRFGVNTSGHVLVYGRDGMLSFSGGITPRRGHEGSCLAASNLAQIMNGPADGTKHWPVYGCPIVSNTEQKR